MMNVFTVNQYITLKLENGKTYIFINGKRFLQCMSLVLNIPKDGIDDLTEIDSIDEAAELLDNPLEEISDFDNFIIPPDMEFTGHCSNLHAWAENSYDTRLLHSNIAFPLLRALSDAGDPQAKKVFRDEIAKRFSSMHPPVAQYLYSEGFLKYLSTEEFNSLSDFYLDLIKTKPDDPNLWFILGICYRFLNKKILSARAFKKAISMSSGTRQILLSLAELYESEGAFTRIERVFRLILEKNPDDFYILRRLADLYLFDQDLPIPALKIYRHILSSRPRNSTALLHLALTYNFLGDYDRSIDTNLQLLEIDNTNDYCLTNLGLTYLEIGDFANAEEAIHSAIVYNPDNFRARGSIIKFNIGFGNYDLAAKLFSYNQINDLRFFTHFGKWGTFFLNNLIEFKKFDVAKKFFYDNLQSTMSPIESAYYAGKLHFYLKNYEIAENIIDDLLKNYPTHLDYLYYKAAIEVRKGNLFNSLDIIRKIDKIDYISANMIYYDDNFKILLSLDDFIKFFDHKFSKCYGFKGLLNNKQE